MKIIEQAEIWWINLPPHRQRNMKVIGGIVLAMVAVAIWNIVM